MRISSVRRKRTPRHRPPACRLPTGCRRLQQQRDSLLALGLADVARAAGRHAERARRHAVADGGVVAGCRARQGRGAGSGSVKVSTCTSTRHSPAAPSSVAALTPEGLILAEHARVVHRLLRQHRHKHGRRRLDGPGRLAHACERGMGSSGTRVDTSQRASWSQASQQQNTPSGGSGLGY